MKKLSTGQDSTMENWLGLCIAVFGEDSKATEFLKKKADDSPKGLQEEEEVLADEGQLLMLLGNLHLNN